MLDLTILEEAKGKLLKHLEDYELDEPLEIIRRREDPVKWLVEMIRLKLDRFEYAVNEEVKRDSLLDAIGYLVLLENLVFGENEK